MLFHAPGLIRDPGPAGMTFSPKAGLLFAWFSGSTVESTGNLEYKLDFQGWI
jgi:hypothetical protein